MKTCLHAIPSAIEEHGAEWPEEWPRRLETYPDWLNDKQKAIDDTKRWKDIVEKSYFTGIGIDWSTIRNVMDMKATYGGYGCRLAVPYDRSSATCNIIIWKKYINDFNIYIYINKSNF